MGIFYQNWYFVFLLFLLVGITDLLDGYLARALKQETNLGKILDPAADKFLLVSSFVALAYLKSPSFSIPSWFVVLIVGREFCIMFGTFLLLRYKKNFNINPTVWGKFTTLFQLLFIFWLFVCHFLSWNPSKTYYILLSFLAIFSVLSFLDYVYIGIKLFLETKNNL